MLPRLFHVGPVSIYSYGILTALGFLLAILWPTSLAKREGISATKMEGLGLLIVLSAGVGSKLLTAWDYPGFYSGAWSHFLSDQVLGRGGVFYGGFLLAVACSAVYCRLVELPGWQVADAVAPGLALAQGLGRVGCFLAGCCWGTPTELPFGVTFSSELAHNITGVPLHVRLHPAQLYEAALVLFVIPFLVWLRKKRSFPGQVILVYVLFYAFARFFLEFLRGDPRGYHFSHLVSTSQLIGLFIIPLAVFLLFHLSEHHRELQGSGWRTVGNARVRKVGVRT